MVCCSIWIGFSELNEGGDDDNDDDDTWAVLKFSYLSPGLPMLETKARRRILLIAQSTLLWLLIHFITVIIIRLEARFRSNIWFTLRGDLAVSTRSAITPLKVNRFGWNLEYSEYIVGGWPWQILGAILAVAKVWGRRNFVFGSLNNARFHPFPVGQRAKFHDIWTDNAASTWHYRHQIADRF